MRVLAITPGDYRDLEPWLDALAEGGVRELLLREPGRTAAELRPIARFAARRFERVWLHARHPHAEPIARELGLGLHQRAGEPPPPAPFGVSCHDAEQVRAALDAGAEYVLLSPVWRPTSKPEDTRPPLGVEGFLSAAQGRPAFALGGVTPARAGLLKLAGAYGVAVLGGFFGLQTPQEARNAAERLTNASGF